MIVSHFLGPYPALLTAVGALLPDLDHPNSLITRLLLGSLEAVTRARVRESLSRTFRHRGALHCPWPWLLGALTTWTHHRTLALVLLGGLFHTLQDMLTARGVPIFPGPRGWIRLALTPIPARHWDYVLIPLALLALTGDYCRSGLHSPALPPWSP